MIKGTRIFPECNADTFFTKLITGKNDIIHCSGINNVAIALKKYKDKNDFKIGLVDTDRFKREDPYFKCFTIVEDKLNEQNLIIRKHPEANDYIIGLHPAFEKWIWDLALSCNIDPAEEGFGFNNIDDLKIAAKTENVYHNVNFKKLIKAIITENPPAIQTIRIWLEKAL